MNYETEINGQDLPDEIKAAALAAISSCRLGEAAKDGENTSFNDDAPESLTRIWELLECDTRDGKELYLLIAVSDEDSFDGEPIRIPDDHRLTQEAIRLAA